MEILDSPEADSLAHLIRTRHEQESFSVLFKIFFPCRSELNACFFFDPPPVVPHIHATHGKIEFSRPILAFCLAMKLLFRVETFFCE